MLERMCPQCSAANPADQRRCSTCGTGMEQTLQPATPVALTPRRVQLPAHWQHTGRVVALGLLSIAVDAGLQWLQQRQQTGGAMRPANQRVVVAQQRIVERWQGGELRERTIERTVWLEPER